MDSREDLWADAMRAERRGDVAAYERLLGDIAEMLRRLIRGRFARLGWGGDDTEDLVQEVLIALHTKRHTWDADRPFLPWLYAIARYKLADAARRLRREARYRRDITPEHWATLFDTPTDDFDRAIGEIGRHLNALPSGQRDVVQALAIDGTTVRATAQKLKTSEGAVRVTLHRALQRLTAAASRDESSNSRGKR
ncbi:sigma-70 family RNA polymerase sigma factor [Beijerinckia sp. L45]|uniref:sigma-70 family RNA polymerase sigma factor n=1 Tax=Beijerinckia sp. L45 TaxID=1641855 RepID=UPI00131C00D0|nr:sigma-70 family RNA polymerase sigma factor [Beijerinckia sp. L45]